MGRGRSRDFCSTRLLPTRQPGLQQIKFESRLPGFYFTVVLLPAAGTLSTTINTRSPASAGIANRHNIEYLCLNLFTLRRFNNNDFCPYQGVMPPDQDDETWRPGSEGMSLSCRGDRMMICPIVLRQHRNVTDDRRHARGIQPTVYIQIDGWLKNGCKGVRCPPIFSLYNLINVGWL